MGGSVSRSASFHLFPSPVAVAKEQSSEEAENRTNQQPEIPILSLEVPSPGIRKKYSMRPRTFRTPGHQVFTTVYAATVIRKNDKVSFRKHFLKKGVLPAAHTLRLNEVAYEIEPQITELLESLAQELGGKLVGLEHRFKTLDSLQQKVQRDLHEANLKLLDDMGEQRDQLCSPTLGPTIRIFNQEESMDKALDEAIANLDRRKRLLKAFVKTMPSARESRIFDSDSIDEEGATISPIMRRAISINEDSTEQKIFKREAQLSKKFTLAVDQANADQLRIEENAVRSEQDVGQIVWNISDALRYTFLLDLETYTSSVKTIMERLKENDISAVSLKNFWPSGDGYQGINNVFALKCEVSPTNQFKFEIQFHTEGSFEQKMSSHDLYEKFRVTIDPDEKMKIFKECCESADAVPVPPDVLSIPYPRIRAKLFIQDLYINLLITRALKLKDIALAQVNKLCDGLASLSEKCTPIVKADLLSKSQVELRLKHEVSLQKKIRKATDEPNQPLSKDYEGEIYKAAVMCINDSLVINIILPEAHYSIASGVLMARLFSGGILGRQQTFTEMSSINGWNTPASFTAAGVTGGVGVYCHVTMEGEDDGVAFTPDDAYPLVIAFHTETSYQAMIALKAAREDFRSANTSRQRKAALTKARSAVSSVTIPKGARMLLSQEFDSVIFDRGDSS